MIENFIDSVLIIDDVEDEIKGLSELLESKDIWVKYFHPENAKKAKSLKNRKLVFLDLYLSKTSGNDVEGHISEIRQILQNAIGKNFGSYGIVIWSAHVDEINKLKQKIANDFQHGRYTMPLFIIGLPKVKYLKEGFASLFADLDAEINGNPAASFFIQWDFFVKQGKDNAISSIYSLVKDYEKQDDLLKYVLFRIAENHTGIHQSQSANYPFEPDAYKALSDILHYEVIRKADTTNTKIFEKPASIQSLKIEAQQQEFLYSEINDKLLIDYNNLNQDFPIPGNVYEILDAESFFIAADAPKDSKHIILEITPPCDFSNNKKGGRSRIVGGFICPFAKEQLQKSYKKENYYSEIWPIKVNGIEKSQMIIFDFRYFGSIPEEVLKNPAKYRLAFRTKDKLFADILQKLSSHASRLGLSIIH